MVPHVLVLQLLTLEVLLGEGEGLLLVELRLMGEALGAAGERGVVIEGRFGEGVGGEELDEVGGEVVLDIFDEDATDEFEVLFEDFHLVVDLEFFVVEGVVEVGWLGLEGLLAGGDEGVLLILVEGEEVVEEGVDLVFAG